MISVANEIADSAFHPGGRASDEILNEAEQKIFRLRKIDPIREAPRVNPLLKRAVDRIDELFNNADSLTRSPPVLMTWMIAPVVCRSRTW